MPNPDFRTTRSWGINRLNRAEGHLLSIVTMIENVRSCRENAQRMHTEEKPQAQVKWVLIDDCLDRRMDVVAGKLRGNRQQGIDGSKTIAKYL